MQKTLPLLMLMLALSSCSLFQVKKIDIEQGNIVTPYMISKLHPGMTKAEVTDLLGTPVMLNTFDDQREDYIYSFKPGHGDMTEKNMTLIFKNNRLSAIGGHY